MLQIYRILINLIYFFLPLVLLIRIFYKKEDKSRFKEKFFSISKKRRKGKLIWFHASSVGEVLSIIPLIEKIEEEKNIKNILVTTNTLSSSKVITKKKYLKKVIHQFLPIDTNSISKKFLNHWKPDLAIFVESEIWPNFIFNIKNANIPLILLNGRFTKKTFKNWKKIPIFAKKIFNKFNLCFIQNNESKKFLNHFNVKNIKNYGNLKYSETKFNYKLNFKKDLIKKFASKKIWCASNTHLDEEEICAKIHLNLKRKIKNLITIIIPRHVNRSNNIIEKLKNLRLNVQLHSKSKKISNSTDIYLVDTFGETQFFYNLCPIIFMGKSFNFHNNNSGQNPIEAARFGCKIFHGPNIKNFIEVYKFLNSLNITKQVSGQEDLTRQLEKNINFKIHKHKYQKKLSIKGNQILDKTYYEIKNYF